ncbi:MAG: hypothetical protein ACKO70_01615 [Actinomycetota bacterium]
MIDAQGIKVRTLEDPVTRLCMCLHGFAQSQVFELASADSHAGTVESSQLIGKRLSTGAAFIPRPARRAGNPDPVHAASATWDKR